MDEAMKNIAYFRTITGALKNTLVEREIFEKFENSQAGMELFVNDWPSVIGIAWLEGKREESNAGRGRIVCITRAATAIAPWWV